MIMDIAIWQLIILICLIYVIGKEMGYRLSKPEMLYRQKDVAE